jgi:hypothetical protein
MLSTRIDLNEQPENQSEQLASACTAPIKVTITTHQGYATIRFAQKNRLLFEAELAPAVAAYLSEALAQAANTALAQAANTALAQAAAHPTATAGAVSFVQRR